MKVIVSECLLAQPSVLTGWNAGVVLVAVLGEAVGVELAQFCPENDKPHAKHRRKRNKTPPPLPRHMLASSAGISQVFMNGHGAQTHEVRFNVDLTIAWG